MNRRQYRRYLRSEAWREKRKRALMRANHQCQYPGCKIKKKLQVHHLTYERLGNEADEDLIVYCDDHHREVHGIVKKKDIKKQGSRIKELRAENDKLFAQLQQEKQRPGMTLDQFNAWLRCQTLETLKVVTIRISP